MLWSDKHTELLVSGIVGALGAVIGSFFTGVSTVLWKLIEARRSDTSRLAYFRNRIAFTDDPKVLTEILRELKHFLLSRPHLLNWKHVWKFFARWLTDQMMDVPGEVHMKIATLDADDRIAELKDQAFSLLRRKPIGRPRIISPNVS